MKERIVGVRLTDQTHEILSSVLEREIVTARREFAETTPRMSDLLRTLIREALVARGEIAP